MKDSDARRLHAAMLTTASIPTCYLCAGRTAGVGLITFPLPNGKQRFIPYPACRECIEDAQDPVQGPRVRAEVERRLIAEFGDGNGH